MRKDIVAHKFIEFGRQQQHLYGLKADSILDVINSDKMCILDVHPQVRGQGAADMSIFMIPGGMKQGWVRGVDGGGARLWLMGAYFLRP